MALSWNVTKVIDNEALHADANEWAITNSLIWGTMGVGISRITEDNYVDFYARLTFLYNSINHESDITVQDVKRRIGLSTNADSETELQFVKRLGMYELRSLRNGATREIERALENA